MYTYLSNCKKKKKKKIVYQSPTSFWTNSVPLFFTTLLQFAQDFALSLSCWTDELTFASRIFWHKVATK